MAIQDIPVFREAQPGQVVRSDDWNEMQQELRNSIRTHRHTGQSADTATDEDNAPQITAEEIAGEAVSLDKLAPEVQSAIEAGGEIGEGAIESAMIADGTIQMGDLAPELQSAIESVGEIPEDAIKSAMIDEAESGTDQDTNTGTGIKTGHIKNHAVTKVKLKPGAVSIAQLSAGLVFEGDVEVPAAPGGGLPRMEYVVLESQVGKWLPRFFLISCHIISPIPSFGSYEVLWQQGSIMQQPKPGFAELSYALVLQNWGKVAITVRCKVYRLLEG
jgi:hypothetical protein